jgi:hypothetical protein
MSVKGKTALSTATIIGLTLGGLGFWYAENKEASARDNAISERVTKIETLQPDLVNRLERIENKLDKLHGL